MPLVHHGRLDRKERDTGLLMALQNRNEPLARQDHLDLKARSMPETNRNELPAPRGLLDRTVMQRLLQMVLQGEEGEVEGEGEEGDEEGEEQAEEGPPQPAPLPIPGTFKRRPSKRFSVVAAEGNPLAQNQAGAKMASGKMISVKVENISDARPITTDELADAVKKISLFE
jgi:hypothetical protein